MTFDIEAIKQQIRLDQLKDYYMRLSDREQYIVLGVAGALGIFFMVFVFSNTIGAMNKLKRQIKQDRETAQNIGKFQKEYQDLKDQVDRLENMVKKTPENFSLTSYLEGLAQEFSISPDSMTPKTAPPNDLYKENRVEVRVMKVTLPNLINYLYRIENSDGVVRVNSLSVKPNFSDPVYLNAVFTVSAFSSKDA